jgi:glycosyltransferase involved in cell wall biosynthesis
LISKRHFDVAIAEYVFFSKALLNFPETTLKVIDTHDVFTDRQKKLKRRGINRCYRYLSRSEEARGLKRADAIIAIQDNEKEFFESLIATPVISVGHTVEVHPCDHEEQPNILFVGTDFPPNLDGLEQFISNCFADIKREVPGAKLLVAGSICKIFQSSDPAVETMGRVADLASAYRRARVVINPVIVGTGLKTKSIEALAYGRPLVSTACGAEGLEDGAGRGMIIADEWTQFSEYVIRILKNLDTARTMSSEATRFITEWNNRQLSALSDVVTGIGK